MDRRETDESPSPSLLSSEEGPRMRRRDPDAIYMTKQQRKTVCAAAALSSAMLIIIFLVALYTVISHHFLASSVYELQQRNDQICLPCTYNAANRQSWERKGECCYSLEGLLDLLQSRARIEAELEVHKQITRMVRSNNGSVSTVAKSSVHLFVSSPKSKFQIVGNDKRINEWRHDLKGAHASSDMTIREGGVTVPRSGLYLIYSQVTVYDDSSSDPGASPSDPAARPPIIKHSVSRYRVHDPNDGLTSLLRRDTAMGPGLTSSYTSGAFQLKAGDTLYVSLCRECTLRSDLQLTYFGVVEW